MGQPVQGGKNGRVMSYLFLKEPSLKEVLLGHLVPSMISTNVMSDEGEMETMATSGSRIRLTVYNHRRW